MLYLLLISFLPIFKYRVGPVLFAAFLSALSWNYFFIPPHYTFHIEKPDDILMFILFFVVASVSWFSFNENKNTAKIIKIKEKRISII